MDFNPIVKGSLLSHRQCKKHLKDQGVKLTRSKTYTDFVNSPEYQRLLHDFARLTGKNSMADSTESKQSQLSIDFKLIYSTCIYEQAIHGRSVWCRLFSQRQLQLLEYGNDLNVYFSGAYGWDINRRLTCDLLQEIVHVFRQAILNRQRRTIRLNFTHAGLMKRLFAMFGISPRFASTHCQTSNSCSNEWRTSLLLPFLANFELTLYECPDARPEWFVMAKIQEHPIRLHGCDQLYCPIDQFFDSYEHLVRDCDLKKICRL